MTEPRPAAGFQIRPATEDDLDVIAGFEIDIARASFGDEAVEDAALHRKRVAGALGKPGEVTLVAVATGAPAVPVGWAWLSRRTNSLTGARYGNFRSLATADVPGRGQAAELLMQAVLQASDQAGFVHLTGKVHATSTAPARPAGRGWRRSWSISSTGTPAAAARAPR